MNPTLNKFCHELQQGNRKLFDTLFSEYYVNLCRFAFTYVRDKDIAEEIVQETFILLWNQKEKLEINTSIRAYLYKAINNRALNYLRDEKTRIGHENEFAKNQALKVSNIIDFCEREELNYLISVAINDLPEQCRTIFQKSREQNMTYNEIASELNISPKTVENQMGIALKKLRAKLSPYLSSIITLF